MRPHLRLCPQREAQTRCFGPLDAECGRVKLRASGMMSLRAAEACKALPRAGFEALCQRAGLSHAAGIPRDLWYQGRYDRNGCRCMHRFKVALQIPAAYNINGLLRYCHLW
jgi:hypothetical protein